MQVKYRRTYIYGSVHIEAEAHTTQISGAAILNACLNGSDSVADRPGTAIRLRSAFEGTRDSKCEALFILGGRQSIIQSLTLQGNSPCIMNNAGSNALYAWFFRKKHTFGKNQTLLMISAGKTPVQLGGWEVSERIDLRYGLGSPYNTPYAEVTPTRLAEICERMLSSKAA
jgi:hypothetical protein